LRFYFGSSSTLISRLFDAPFDTRNFWLDEEAYAQSHAAKLHLAAGISGRSASDIGRIAYSKSARLAAEMIGASCIAASANGDPVYVKTRFPFEGESSISASGKWLKSGANERKVFLVFKLLTCSHPFPFAKLHYTLEKSGGSAGLSTSAETPSARRKTVSAPKRLDSKVISDDEPFRSKPPRGIGMLFGRMQFPDLARKPVSRVDDNQPTSVQIVSEGTVNITSSSVGSGGGMKGIQAIDIVAPVNGEQSTDTSKYDSTESLLLSRILSGLTSTGEFAGCGFIPLNSRQKNFADSVMPQICDEHGEILAECLHETANQKGAITFRNRRICIGKAESLYSMFVFMIPELGADLSLEVHVVRDDARSLREVNDIIAAIATHFGGRKVTDGWHQLREGVVSAALKFQFRDAADQSELAKFVITRFLTLNAQAFAGSRMFSVESTESALEDPLAYLK
jgi:hypothetical protein